MSYVKKSYVILFKLSPQATLVSVIENSAFSLIITAFPYSFKKVPICFFYTEGVPMVETCKFINDF